MGGNVNGLIHKMERKINNLYKKILFLDMRVRAYEETLSHPWHIFRSIIDPLWLRYHVDSVQMRMISEHDKEVMESIKKHQEEDSKPKLQIIGANSEDGSSKGLE